MGSFPCGCEGRKWVFGPCANGRSQGKPSTCFLCSCRSVREIQLYRTCSGFRIVKPQSFLANLPRYEENDYRICHYVEGFGSKLVQFSTEQKASGVFGASVSPAMLPSRAPDAGRHFQLLNQS